MSNYNTLSRDIYTVKRSIFNYSSKLSEGMQKPNKNFTLDMFFGLAKGKSVLLSDIARMLEEPIDTIQTVKRLSSRLEKFHEEDQLVENYGKMITPYFKERDNLVIVDNSEIVRPHSNKLKALGKVRDGSTGRIKKGYWTTNMIGITPTAKHPTPLYSHLFLSMMITFMSLKTEKKNDFFHAVIARARAIKKKSRIKMFLYRFSAGMKAILEKDIHGIQHFKYIDSPKNPEQLEMKLAI